MVDINKYLVTKLSVKWINDNSSSFLDVRLAESSNNLIQKKGVKETTLERLVLEFSQFHPNLPTSGI